MNGIERKRTLRLSGCSASSSLFTVVRSTDELVGFAAGAVAAPVSTTILVMTITSAELVEDAEAETAELEADTAEAEGGVTLEAEGTTTLEARVVGNAAVGIAAIAALAALASRTRLLLFGFPS